MQVCLFDCNDRVGQVIGIFLRSHFCRVSPVEMRMSGFILPIHDDALSNDRVQTYYYFVYHQRRRPRRVFLRYFKRIII